MKAVVYRGPYDFQVEEVPEPQLQQPSDVILKVKYSGICGTDLHTYRGHIKGVPDKQVLGHEFVGTVVEKGADVTSVNVGDSVVLTFTIQCGKCWYCQHGKSGQCEITNTFGKKGLPGGQAEYVRVPYADNTVIKVLPDISYVMMADIFTTGYYGVKKIVNYISTNPNTSFADVSILQVGLGPVGVCALYVLKHLGFTNVTAVDNVPERLQKARDLGFQAVNFEDGLDDLGDFDNVLEVVGSSAALKTAFEHVRRDGLISSLGMAHEPFPFTGLDCYLKNINMSFGRCHSWSLFPEALEIFDQLKDEFTDFVDKVIPIEEAPQGYKLFDEHKARKVVIAFD